MARTLTVFLGLAALAGFVPVSAFAQAPPPGFYIIPPQPERESIHREDRFGGLSSNGAVYAATGRFNTGSGPDSIEMQAFNWTYQTGSVGVTGSGVPNYVRVFGISGNGQTIVGNAGSIDFNSPGDNVAYQIANYTEAFRKTADGPMEWLGVPPTWPRSTALNASDDGGVVVGYAAEGIDGDYAAVATAWLPSGNYVLGYTRPGDHSHSYAEAVSRDGTTVVGFSEGGGLSDDAFIWREGEGMTVLPHLPGPGRRSSSARGVSDTGQFVVGSSRDENGVRRPVMWDNGVLIDLDPQRQYIGFTPSDVSADGSVIAAGGRIWTPAHGAMLVKDYLAMFGVVIPTHISMTANHVSSDGMVFSGLIRISGADSVPYVAAIPSPGACTVGCAIAFFAFRRRRA